MGRPPTRRPTNSPTLATLQTPLARWGFTTLAVLALATAQTGPFLVTADWRPVWHIAWRFER